MSSFIKFDSGQELHKEKPLPRFKPLLNRWTVVASPRDVPPENREKNEKHTTTGRGSQDATGTLQGREIAKPPAKSLNPNRSEAE